MSTPKIGRPPILGPNPKVKNLKFNREDFRRMEQAAATDGIDLSSWIRGVIRRSLDRRRKC